MIFDRQVFKNDRTKRWKPAEVHIIWGDGGTGKDQTVYDLHGDNVYELQKDASGAVWFDGYQGEDILLISDFYGWIAYSTLLNLTAGRPYRLNTKGGNCLGLFKKVYITSNDHPDTWYDIAHPDGLTPAMKSRVKTFKKYVSIDDDEECDYPAMEVVQRPNYRTR